MSTYSIVLLLHIVGALGFFVVQGLEWIGLSRIRSAELREEAQAILGIVEGSDRLGMVSMLTIVVTGVYMWLTVWGGVAWILVVLGALVLEIVLFVALTRPRMAAIGQALAAEKGTLSTAFHDAANHPVLWISVLTRVAILLDIVFLKIAKPDLGWSLVTVAIAIVLALAAALPMSRRARAQEASAD